MDRRGRELGRRAQAAGTTGSRSEIIAHLLRTGQINVSKVELAAWLGDGDSREALGTGRHVPYVLKTPNPRVGENPQPGGEVRYIESCPLARARPRQLLSVLFAWSPWACARAVLSVLEPALMAWAGQQELNETHRQAALADEQEDWGVDGADEMRVDDYPELDRQPASMTRRLCETLKQCTRDETWMHDEQAHPLMLEGPLTDARGALYAPPLVYNASIPWLSPAGMLRYLGVDMDPPPDMNGDVMPGVVLEHLAGRGGLVELDYQTLGEIDAIGELGEIGENSGVPLLTVHVDSESQEPRELRGLLDADYATIERHVMRHAAGNEQNRLAFFWMATQQAARSLGMDDELIKDSSSRALIPWLLAEVPGGHPDPLGPACPAARWGR